MMNPLRKRTVLDLSPYQNHGGIATTYDPYNFPPRLPALSFTGFSTALDALCVAEGTDRRTRTRSASTTAPRSYRGSLASPTGGAQHKRSPRD